MLHGVDEELGGLASKRIGNWRRRGRIRWTYADGVRVGISVLQNTVQLGHIQPNLPN